ncbi:hypothetical protein TNCV_3913741 [Trichonephila clavipes]|nr:hypothetical protein TNCV_3913741 [Trichonephila clavipes]
MRTWRNLSDYDPKSPDSGLSLGLSSTRHNTTSSFTVDGLQLSFKNASQGTTGIFLHFPVREPPLLLSFPLNGQNSPQQRPLSGLSCAMCHALTIPSTTTEWRARYNPHIHTLSACRIVPRLNTSSPSTTKGNGSQIKTSDRIGFRKNFHSVPCTSRLMGGIFQSIRNFIQCRCHACQMTYGREHLFNTYLTPILLFSDSLHHTSQLRQLRICIPM